MFTKYTFIVRQSRNETKLKLVVEWVADNQGNLEGKGEEEQRIPGFEEFSPRQMFWVSFAQMYCAKWTDAGVFKLLTEVMPYIADNIIANNNKNVRAGRMKRGLV